MLVEECGGVSGETGGGGFVQTVRLNEFFTQTSFTHQRSIERNRLDEERNLIRRRLRRSREKETTSDCFSCINFSLHHSLLFLRREYFRINEQIQNSFFDVCLVN